MAAPYWSMHFLSSLFLNAVLVTDSYIVSSLSAILGHAQPIQRHPYIVFHSGCFLCVFIAKDKFNIPTEADIYVWDDTGTEVDEEVFSDIVEEKPDILWTIVDVLSLTGK